MWLRKQQSQSSSDTSQCMSTSGLYLLTMNLPCADLSTSRSAFISRICYSQYTDNLRSSLGSEPQQAMLGILTSAESSTLLKGKAIEYDLLRPGSDVLPSKTERKIPGEVRRRSAKWQMTVSEMIY